MNRTVSQSWLAAQAGRLIAHLDQTDRRRFQRFPHDAVRGAGVTVRTGTVFRGDCGLAGMYTSGLDGPTITFAPSASSRRDNFTVLHEFGHHLIGHDETVAELLLDLDDGRAVEEVLADRVAADLLLPPGVVDRLLADGVDAAGVARLFERTEASREACCVAAARRLPGAGYVVVADLNGTVRFAAAAGTPYRIARSTPQPGGHLLGRAGRTGRATGQDRLHHASGAGTPIMHGIAVRSEGYVFGVFTSGMAPWVDLHMLPADEGAGRMHECGDCGRRFRAGSDRCDRCGDPVCFDCGSCSCPPGVAGPDRLCEGCQLFKGVGQFDGDATRCRDCD